MQTTIHPLDGEIDVDWVPPLPQWIERFGHVEGPAIWRTQIAPALLEVLDATTMEGRRAMAVLAERAIREAAAGFEELDPHHAALLLGACEDVINTPLDIRPDELVAIAAAAWDLGDDL